MKKRFILTILILLILSSFMPSFSHGEGWFKELNGFFGEFDLKVNGKKIPYHREPFIYDEEFYICLDDLARGLNMDIIKRGNSFFLDSKGRLKNIEDISKEPLVFQRGYEARAKENIIEGLEDYIRGLDGKEPLAIDYKLYGSLKKINVGFGNIDVYLDDVKINLHSQPIKYQDMVYVNVDSIAAYLYITPNLSRDKKSINIDSNGILIPTSSNSSMDNLFAILEGKHYLLDLQKAELERKLFIMEDLKLPYDKLSDIGDLEKYINKHFNKIKDLEIKVGLSQQANWINLDISFPTSKHSLWKKLKRSDVEDWTWNVYSSILNLYDEDILLSGVIRNPYYKITSPSLWKNHLEFYTKDNDIFFDFSKSNLPLDKELSLDRLLQVLNQRLAKYYNIDFDYQLSMSANDIVIVSRAGSDTLNDFGMYSKMGYLKALNNVVKSLYPDRKVEGDLVFPSGDIEAIDFTFVDNTIRSISLMAETMDYINQHYGSFTSGANTYNLDFSLHEKDVNKFYLAVYTDIPSKLSQTFASQINARVGNAARYIVSIWNASLSMEVFDASGNLISDFNIYQENVSSIYANPSGGEVAEGSLIYLYVDTPGADIYYSLDGSTPTLSSNLYDGNGIRIYGDTRIKAFGFKEGLGYGPESSFDYSVETSADKAYGLDALTLSPGSISFARTSLNYNVDLPSEVDRIYITPVSNRENTSISIVFNGASSNVISGENHELELVEGENLVYIDVNETGKTPLRYRLNIVRQSPSGELRFKVEDLVFSTILGDKVIFNGILVAVNANNYSFADHRIKLFNNVDEAALYEEIVNSDGSFAFNRSITLFDKLMGFRYEVWKGDTKLPFIQGEDGVLSK